MAAEVARKMVEDAGVDVNRLLKMLIKNASAELTTYYYYTILRTNLTGFEGEGLKGVAEDARIEDRNHFEALVPRIYELGGKLPDDMKVFHDMSACPPANLPAEPSDVKEIVKILLKAEQCAVKGYTEICNMTAGKDHRTYDLALAILNEEIEHEAWFSEILGKGPSGHFMRPNRQNSPFVSKFLH
ncbi:MAG: DNA protection protein DPS [Nanoarchaeota archaeon]|nr:DNA protection protein DPS [Nanoarchaeota archaeon]